MKRILSILLCGAMMLGILSSCSIAAEKKKIELSYWTLSSRLQLTESVVKDFEAANPDIKIKFTFNSTDGHKQNLKIAASSKTMPSMWFNWGGSLGSFYPENGLTYDLTNYAKEKGWKDLFVPSSLQLATFNNQLSGYPTSINMLGIFYRKDIFQKLGIKVPQTFEEFEQLMATIKKNGIIPLSTGGKFGWHVMRLVEALIEMYAGADQHTKLSALDADWTSEGVVKAFEKFKEYTDKGYFPDGFVTLDPNEVKLLMYSGKAAMQIEGPWANNNFYADKQDASLYGYFKIPLSDKGNRMSAFIEMIQFNSKLSKEELEAAVRFVDFIYSPQMVEKYGPMIKQPLPYLNNKLPAKLKLVPDMVKDMNKYGTYTISDQALPQEIANKLFEAQDSIATGKMSPKDAATFMQKAVETYKATK